MHVLSQTFHTSAQNIFLLEFELSSAQRQHLVLPAARASDQVMKRCVAAPGIFPYCWARSACHLIYSEVLRIGFEEEVSMQIKRRCRGKSTIPRIELSFHVLSLLVPIAASRINPAEKTSSACKIKKIILCCSYMTSRKSSLHSEVPSQLSMQK